MRRLTARKGLAAALCLLGILSSGTAGARQAPERDGDPAARLSERDREAMHPADPLRLSGLDQGDGGFRARTPALLRSDRSATLIDEAESYRRRIAMYERGASYSKPPAACARLLPAPEPRSPAEKASIEEGVGPDAGSLILAAALFAALVALILKIKQRLVPEEPGGRVTGR